VQACKLKPGLKVQARPPDSLQAAKPYTGLEGIVAIMMGRTVFIGYGAMTV